MCKCFSNKEIEFVDVEFLVAMCVKNNLCHWGKWFKSGDGWGRPVVKITCCSFWGPKLDSQHLSLQLTVACNPSSRRPGIHSTDTHGIYPYTLIIKRVLKIWEHRRPSPGKVNHNWVTQEMSQTVDYWANTRDCFHPHVYEVWLWVVWDPGSGSQTRRGSVLFVCVCVS